MKFIKLTVNNFRQYKGLNEIEFSTDPEKNITVVYGPITTGKTTLLQAFNWVLYDKINLQNPDLVYNLEEARDIKPGEDIEVFVELLIEKDEIEKKQFKFRRTVKYRYFENKGLSLISESAVASVKENDTWVKLDDYEEQVNMLLPSKLSNYFFFDGERIKVIGNQQKKGEQEVGEAVKSILGLEDFNTAIKHLTGPRSVMTELRNSLNNTAGNEMDSLKRKIEKYDELIDEKTQTRDRLDAEISNLKNKKEEKQKIIAENKTTAEYQQQKQALQKQIDINTNKRIEAYADFKRYFNKYYLDFFYTGLSGKIDDITKSGILNIKNEAIPNMNDKSVKYLIKRGYCVCGEKLVEGDEHYKFLMEEMQKLPPKEIGGGISDFNREIKYSVSDEKSNYFKDEVTRKFSEICSLNNEINDATDKLEKVSKLIQTDIDVGALEAEVREIDSKIEDYSRMVGQKNSDIESLKRDKESDTTKLSSLAGFDEKNQKILREIDYTNRISDILTRMYSSKEKKLITELEKEINLYLDKIYAGERIMKINSDYTFHLKYQDGDEIDSAESEGLGIVKAISFMCGLFEVAKKKLIKELKDIDSETMYPLVFDAPLSNVGSYERKNIMHYLPEVASQIIVFTREPKDLEDIDKDTKDKIFKTYNINKLSEKYSHIEKGAE